jgi:hypothetical protein
MGNVPPAIWTWCDDRGWIMPDGTPLVPDRAAKVKRQRHEALYRLLVTGGPSALVNYYR